MRALFSFIAGSMFGVGLLVSGMTDTTKVQGWLDLFGEWDPTLAFVMGGAIIPMAIAWRFTQGRKPALGGEFPAPPKTEIGRKLVIGSTLFGMGWGLVGLCPGPAMASLSYAPVGGFVFVAAMIAGMLIAPYLNARLDAVPAAA